jgi:hypothetical protein
MRNSQTQSDFDEKRLFEVGTFIDEKGSQSNASTQTNEISSKEIVTQTQSEDKSRRKLGKDSNANDVDRKTKNANNFSNSLESNDKKSKGIGRLSNTDGKQQRGSKSSIKPQQMDNFEGIKNNTKLDQSKHSEDKPKGKEGFPGHETLYQESQNKVSDLIPIPLESNANTSDETKNSAKLQKVLNKEIKKLGDDVKEQKTSNSSSELQKTDNFKGKTKQGLKTQNQTGKLESIPEETKIKLKNSQQNQSQDKNGNKKSLALAQSNASVKTEDGKKYFAKQENEKLREKLAKGINQIVNGESSDTSRSKSHRNSKFDSLNEIKKVRSAPYPITR